MDGAVAPGGAADDGRDEADVVASLFNISAIEKDEADCCCCWATLAELIVFGW